MMNDGVKGMTILDTVIVGAGQAGLGVSYYLQRDRRPHVVLERGRLGESWLTQRWDSFKLNTPNFMNVLPGLPYDGPEPDGFWRRDELIRYFQHYRGTLSTASSNGCHSCLGRARQGRTALHCQDKSRWAGRGTCVEPFRCHRCWYPTYTQDSPIRAPHAGYHYSTAYRQLPQRGRIAIRRRRRGGQWAIRLPNH